MVLLKAGCIIKAAIANTSNCCIPCKLVSNFYVIDVWYNVSFFVNNGCIAANGPDGGGKTGKVVSLLN